MKVTGHPHYCYKCHYAYTAKTRLEKCLKCKGTKVINWAGETWNQAEVQAGVTKSVCPASYIVNQSTVVSSTGVVTFWYATNRWTNTGLDLARKVHTRFYSFSGACSYFRDFANNFNRVFRSPIAYGGRSFSGCGTTHPMPATNTTSGFLTITGVLAAPEPTFGDYLITNEFFGSVTVSGILYTWSKGTGWP